MIKKQNFSVFLPLLINGGLFGFKLGVGLTYQSAAVFTDAINNLFDWISSVLYWIGVHVSKKTPDEGHPLGHGRAEYIITLVLGTIISVVGLQLIFDSIVLLLNPKPINFHPLFWVVTGLSLVLKFMLVIYFLTQYRKTSLTSQKAIAFDSLGDVFISTGFLVGFMIHLFLPSLNIDGWLGLFVALIILTNGVTFTIKTAKDMLGRPLSLKTQQQLITILKSNNVILGMHSLVFHDYGPYHKHITFHLEVPNTLSLVESHNVIDRLEQKILNQLNFECLIHIDPLITDSLRLNNLITPIQEALSVILPSKQPTIKLIDEIDHPEVVLYGYDFREFQLIQTQLHLQFPQYVFIFGETLF
jgi:cation diffusion facilitator family transporter